MGRRGKMSAQMLVALLGIATIACTGSAAFVHDMKVMIPLYTAAQASGGVCTAPDWVTLAAHANAASVTAIVNANNGPPVAGTEATWSTCVRLLRDAGVTVIGYIHSKITSGFPSYTPISLRPQADLLADVEAWQDALGVGQPDGIFVDEVSDLYMVNVTPVLDGDDQLEFYASLFAAIKTHDGWADAPLVVANTGTIPPMEFLFDGGAPIQPSATQHADVILTYEASLQKWDPTLPDYGYTSCEAYAKANGVWCGACAGQTFFDPGPWCPYLDPGDGLGALPSAAAAGTLGVRLAAAAYGAPSDMTTAELTGIAAQAKAAGLEYVYVTDDGLPNPWDSLPSFGLLPDAAGSVQGDPHFVGFDGVAFDYNGEPGRAFNVISSPEVQVNALLGPDLQNGLTYMNVVGISIADGTRMKLSVEDGHAMITVNELEVKLPHTFRGVDLRPNPLDGNDIDVSIPGFELTFHVHKDNFVDLARVETSWRAPIQGIHGVLGQTARSDRASNGIEGMESDYFVSDLWSSDFKYDMYQTLKTNVEQGVNELRQQ